jgi:sulfur-carrier protein
MKIKVRIPLSLCIYTGNKTEFECIGSTVEDLLDDLDCQFPAIREVLYDEEGKIKSTFSFLVNGKIVKLLKGGKIALKEGDEFLIMQLVAGG